MSGDQEIKTIHQTFSIVRLRLLIFQNNILMYLGVYRNIFHLVDCYE